MEGMRQMDSVRETTQRIRLNQWAGMIRERQNSGMSVRKWCKENGINEKAYYYRQRKVREALVSMDEADLPALKSDVSATFAKVPSPAMPSTNPSPVASININGAKIEVYEGAGEEIIHKSLKAVLSLC